MSLLGVYRREIILAIEQKHAEISEGGSFKVVVVKKEDDPGPHRDAFYQREILKQFHMLMLTAIGSRNRRVYVAK